MAYTYSSLLVHYVFAVRGRQNLLLPPWRKDVFKYISGIIEGKNQKSIIVNGVSDHVHALVGLSPSMRVSDLVRDMKNNSSNYINHYCGLNGRFSWQEGYGAFSLSKSEMGRVYDYISNQELHLNQKSFKPGLRN